MLNYSLCQAKIWGDFMTIGEISKATHLPASTLRYYEKKGLIRVSRDANNRRVYDKSDVAWIEFINRLKETGMILRDIQNYSELRYRGEETMAQRLKILREHRKIVLNELEKWRNYLQNLDDKIKFYEENI